MQAARLRPKGFVELSPERYARRRNRAEAGHLSPVYLAEVHAGLVERRAALAYLEEAYRQRSPRLVEIAQDVGMRPLARRPGVRPTCCGA